MLRTCFITVAIILVSFGVSQARPHRHNISCQSAGGCATYQPHYYYYQPQQIQRKTYVRQYHKKKRVAKRTRSTAKVKKQEATPPWNMVKVKTVQGFYLTVHPAYAHKFLRLFELLQIAGIKVPKDIVGCYAAGGHKRGSNHYIGAACDIQWGWNKTIPAMYHAGSMIKAAGLYDGCSFGDCGHVEAVRGLYNKKPNLYASMEKFKVEQSTANYQP